MKKLITLLTSLCLCLSAFASHEVAANLYWDYLGNNQYYFTLELIGDKAGVGLSTWPQTLNGPTGSYALPLESISDYDCYSGPQSGLSIAHYRDTITLNGVPPATGWEFNWRSCCYASLENSGILVGIYASAVIYPVNQGLPAISTAEAGQLRPVFFGRDNGSGSFLLKPNLNATVDSIAVELRRPLTGSNQPASFLAGYDSINPLPDRSEDSANGANIFNSRSGLFEVEIVNGTEGQYIFGAAVHYFQNGQKVATLRRNLAYLHDSTYAAFKPIISLKRNGVNQNYSGGSYQSTVFLGDSLNLEVSATEIGSVIKASYDGAIVNNQYLTQNPQLNGVQISALNSSGTFTQATQNSVKLSWQPSPANYVSPLNPVQVNLYFKDTSCTAGRLERVVPVLIEVIRPVSIAADTLKPCGNSTDSLSADRFRPGSFWSPGNMVNDSLSANTILSPQAQGWLHLIDPASGLRDSVFIERMDSSGYYLSQSASNLILNDAYQLPQNLWIYNGFLAGVDQDSLPLLGPGQYQVQAVNAACPLQTPAFTVNAGSLSMNNIPKPPFVNTAPASLDSVRGMEFQLMAVGNRGPLKAIRIMGLASIVESSSADLKIMMYDRDNILIWSDSTTVHEPGLLTFDQNLPVLSALEPYTLALQADSALQFELISDFGGSFMNVYPIGSLDVFGARSGANATSRPQTQTTLMPAFALSFDPGIGLQEAKLDFSLRLYPNPARHALRVENAQAKVYQILSLAGKELQSGSLSQEPIDIRSLAPGLYILKAGAQSQGFVKE